jgi:predicted DNA-binding mobile mystery protein A
MYKKNVTMRNKKKLLIEQLDQKLAGFKSASMVLVPQRGWINTIRTTFNMTRDQLGTKLKMTQGAIQKIEEREATGQISINKLRDVGTALDMQFVYGFIPKDGTIENIITKRAEKLARKIVLRTNQNMKLEDQGIGDLKINETIKELASEIKREMRKSLWD